MDLYSGSTVAERPHVTIMSATENIYSGAPRDVTGSRAAFNGTYLRKAIKLGPEWVYLSHMNLTTPQPSMP